MLHVEAVEANALVEDALAQLGAAGVHAKGLDFGVVHLDAKLLAVKCQLAALGPGEGHLWNGDASSGSVAGSGALINGQGREPGAAALAADAYHGLVDAVEPVDEEPARVHAEGQRRSLLVLNVVVLHTELAGGGGGVRKQVTGV